MTRQEYIEYLKRLTMVFNNTTVLFNATTLTMVQMQRRIWTDGQLTNGSPIQYKEDYQVYIYKPPFPQKPNGKGKTGRKIKGQWAPTYLAAKASQGRKDFPFELTGDMRISWLGGPVPSPRVSDGGLLCEIVMSDEQWKKAEGIAKQKGEFLELTDFEIQYQAEQVQRLINEALR
jgi:hypothetical protein